VSEDRGEHVMDLGSPFAIGAALGILLGAFVAGMWMAVRLRTEQVAHIDSAERVQRTETESGELRRRLHEEQAVTSHVREELARAQQACAVAETRAEETHKNLQEQKALLHEARQGLQTSFQALSGEALKQNNETFLKLAQSSFATLQAEAKGEWGQRQTAIDELIRPLQDSLKRYEEHIRQVEQSRVREFGGLEQHLKMMAESQQRLQQETGNLVKALRTPTVRGQWGEITLRRVAELAGMVAHCDFVEQEMVHRSDGAFRPDMVVRLPGGRQIVVDAKTVLSAYLDALESQDEAQRQAHLLRHAEQVRSRMDDLSVKAYWSQFDLAPEFVVLFLPGEQFLGAALEQDPSLIENGFARGVVIATPTTLVALLRAVAYGWRQERLTEHAELAGRLGKDLFERMAVLAEHLSDVGSALGKSVQAYNKAVGSLETRILPAARKFKELGIPSDKDMALLEPVEVMPRDRAVVVAEDVREIG